jgi:hypothetical protein
MPDIYMLPTGCEDPTPGDMAYVVVCPRCHGVWAFWPVSSTHREHLKLMHEALATHRPLWRVPGATVRDPDWGLCRCDFAEQETQP